MHSMTRMLVITCFALTLLCPVFCLAQAGDDCCAQTQTGSDNCEAMSFGAVVEKPGAPESLLCRALSAIDGFLPPASLGSGSLCCARSTFLPRSHTKSPPPATRRQALLQTFLF